MTKFLDKSFSVYSGTGQQYRDNWDAIFGKKGLHGQQPCGECGGSDNPADWGHKNECSFWDEARPPK